jgi:nitrous oxide reductase accessory protein NosL
MKVFFYLVIFCLSLQACTQNTDSKTDAKSTASCQNCGMDWAKYPKSAASLETQAGKQLNFCSNRCMFTVVLSTKPSFKIKKSQVVDYFTQQKIDAQTAFYVIGSDQMGSMGHDFIAHKSKQAAQDFEAEHQGKKIVSFQEVTLELVQQVSTGKMNQ